MLTALPVLALQPLNVNLVRTQLLLSEDHLLRVENVIHLTVQYMVILKTVSPVMQIASDVLHLVVQIVTLEYHLQL